MDGKSGGDAAWGEDDDEDDDLTTEDTDEEVDQEDKRAGKLRGSREGKWESGKGRCAVTGRRVLGGTDGLRRVMV